MAIKSSIWTIEGRLERTGKKVTSEKSEKLKKKRHGQLKRLIEFNTKASGKVINRWKDRLCH